MSLEDQRALATAALAALCADLAEGEAEECRTPTGRVALAARGWLVATVDPQDGNGDALARSEITGEELLIGADGDVVPLARWNREHGAGDPFLGEKGSG